MRWELIFLLVLCAIAAAMVPRNRRDENSKEPKLYCAPQTPCAWSIYNKAYKNLIEMTVNNTYCVCEPGQVCVQGEDNEGASAYVHRCIATAS